MNVWNHVQVDIIVKGESDAHPGLPCGTGCLRDGAAGRRSRVFVGEPDL